MSFSLLIKPVEGVEPCDLEVLDAFLNQEQFQDYVAVVQGSYAYSNSVEISKEQLQFLYDVIVTRPENIKRWLETAVSFENLIPYDPGDAMSEFLCELCKALYKHDTTIEYKHNGRWEEVQSRPLANMLYLYGEPLRKEYLQETAPIFASLFDGIFDITSTKTLSRWFYDVNNVHCIEDFPMYVADAVCKSASVAAPSVQLMDLPDDLFESIFKMAMYQTALVESSIPGCSWASGYYISQRKYCKYVSECARLHSKFYNLLPLMQVGSVMNINSVPRSRPSRIRSSESQPNNPNNTCIIDKDLLKIETDIPYVDMRFCFPKHTKDVPNKDGICRHGDKFVTCKGCDKSVKVAMLNICSRKGPWGDNDVELWCDVKCKLGSTVKDSQHLHSKHLSNGLGYLVAPQQIELESDMWNRGIISRSELFDERRENNVSEYSFSVRHLVTARSGAIIALQRRPVGNISLMTPREDIPVRLMTILKPLKSTHLYPTGVQFLPSTLSLPIAPINIHVKRPPTKEKKAMKRKRLTAFALST
jgi:hypothetical protein